jgi:hypothetical protein
MKIRLIRERKMIEMKKAISNRGITLILRKRWRRIILITPNHLSQEENQKHSQINLKSCNKIKQKKTINKRIKNKTDKDLVNPKRCKRTKATDTNIKIKKINRINSSIKPKINKKPRPKSNHRNKISSSQTSNNPKDQGEGLERAHLKNSKLLNEK